MVGPHKNEPEPQPQPQPQPEARPQPPAPSEARRGDLLGKLDPELLQLAAAVLANPNVRPTATDPEALADMVRMLYDELAMTPEQCAARDRRRHPQNLPGFL